MQTAGYLLAVNGKVVWSLEHYFVKKQNLETSVIFCKPIVSHILSTYSFYMPFSKQSGKEYGQARGNFC